MRFTQVRFKNSSLSEQKKEKAAQGPCDGAPPIGTNQALVSFRIKARRKPEMKWHLHPPSGQPIEG